MTSVLRSLIVTVAFSVLTVFQLHAQSHIWTDAFKGDNTKSINGIAKDKKGNIYTVGGFSGTIDMDPGAATLSFTTSISTSMDMYVTKLAPDGSLIWAKQVGGNNQINVARDIVIGMDGSVNVIGDFRGTVDFDPGPSIFNLTSVGSSGNGCILKLDPNGNFLKADAFVPITTSQVFGRFIRMDHSGNIVAVFSVSFGSIDMDPGPGVTAITTAGNDFIICKLSPSGTLLWAKLQLSGSDTKEIGDMQLDAGDNILLCGYFYYTLDFDAGPGVSELTSTGSSDGYVAKLTPSGDFKWAKQFSNGFELINIEKISSDAVGNIYCGGYFEATTDFDPGPGVFSFFSENGLRDACVVKLNSNGEFTWAKQVSSSSNANADDILVDSEGNVTIPLSYDGTMDADPGPGVVTLSSPGNSSLSIIRLNTDGTFISAEQITSNDWVFSITSIIDEDNNIYIGGLFSGTTDFDPGPATNNITAIGIYPKMDVFVVKMGESDFIKGNVYRDINTDGVQQANENGMSHVIVKAVRNNLDYYSISDSAGAYTILADTGAYNITPALPLYYTSILPANHNADFGSEYGKIDSLNHFGLSPSSIVRDLNVAITNLGPARPGRVTAYRITYENTGTEAMSGTITVSPDIHLTFASADPAPFTINANTITWNFTNLAPSQSGNITLYMTVSALATMGMVLTTHANVTVPGGDFNPFNDNDSVHHLVTASFDPNDKTVSPNGPIPTSFVSNGEYLDYTIRFQNTGNDTAFTIIVRDTLSSNVDITSFKMISASHPYSLKLKGDGILEWRFNNILLPDSTTNEAASHGFIRYKIKTKNTLVVGDEIKNKASIYFDFNVPVITNEAYNIVSSTIPLQLLSFTGQKKEKQVNLYWKTTNEINTSYFIIEHATNGGNFSAIGNVRTLGNTSLVNNYTFTHLFPARGNNYYRLKMMDLDNKWSYSPMLVFDFKTGYSLNVVPNPATDLISINHPQGNGSLRLTNSEGKTIYSQEMDRSSSETKLSLVTFKPGVYFITWTDGNLILSKKIIKY